LHAPPSDSADHDEELCVRGNTVIWSAGGSDKFVTRQVFHVEGPVVQACWCNLPEPHAFEDEVTASESDTRTLCIVEDLVLSLFAATGAMFSVPLPFKVSQVFPLSQGILILRDTTATTGYGGFARGLSTGPSEEQQTGPRPVLFSLLHPLDELKPVCWEQSSGTEWDFVTDEVIFADGQLPLPLVMTYKAEQIEVSVMQLLDATHQTEHLAPELTLKKIYSDGCSALPAKTLAFVDITGNTLLAYVNPAVQSARGISLTADATGAIRL